MTCNWGCWLTTKAATALAVVGDAVTAVAVAVGVVVAVLVLVPAVISSPRVPVK